MKKLILIAILVSASFNLSAQNKFSLRSDNIPNHIGKTTKEDFEVLVGEPDDSYVEGSMTVYLYNVYNIRYKGDNGELQAFFCLYRNDGKLIRLWYLAEYPNSQLLGFIFQPGFDKTRNITRKNSAGVTTYHRGSTKDVDLEIDSYQNIGGVWNGVVPFSMRVD